MKREKVEQTPKELLEQIENLNSHEWDRQTDGCKNEYGIELSLLPGNHGGVTLNMDFVEEGDELGDSFISIHLYPDGTYKTFIVPTKK